ncbi:MAG: 4-hydroxythreonine-4-phosphate dehydrogenase PdxA [bacterium]
MNNFIFTCGDINGIGPEISLKCINKIYSPHKRKLFFICSSNVFEYYYKRLSLTFPFEVFNKFNQHSIDSPEVCIISPEKNKFLLGNPTYQSGEASFIAIETAYNILTNQLHGNGAMITAPISKHAFELAGIKYPGHSEMLAEWCGTEKFMMMFLSRKYKMGLVTIHEPIKKIASLLTRNRLKQSINVALKSLRSDFGITSPKIAVLGLNPHAGENGRIGMEEERVIKPIIASMIDQKLVGPFSPDAYFATKMYRKYDLTLGMYHDQILIPFKMMSFDEGVNYTAGLPIIRTSPDHGTAFDIAGEMIAHPGSIISAFNFAERILQNRKSFSIYG